MLTAEHPAMNWLTVRPLMDSPNQALLEWRVSQ